VKTSPYTKGVGIVTSWPTMGSISKIFYFNPEMPFLMNGPMVVNNKDFSYDEEFLSKDSIMVGNEDLKFTDSDFKFYDKTVRPVKVPEMTCPLEADIIAYHQNLMSIFGPDEYLSILKEKPKFSTDIENTTRWVFNPSDKPSKEWEEIFKE